jgi:NADH-quinone oxidoreductase subunit I
MFGLGILRGFWTTIRHLWESYWDDLRWWGRRYGHAGGIARRSSKNATGIFTIQYPGEKLPVPEAFRFFPFLVYAETEDANRKIRCTACGICAKVCPPQCIWIQRVVDPVTGKPIPRPEAFYIDIDLCMSCGFCVEYCPFDAIQMDHAYELAGENRAAHLMDMAHLLKPESYYAEISPRRYQTEQLRKKAKAERST